MLSVSSASFHRSTTPKRRSRGLLRRYDVALRRCSVVLRRSSASLRWSRGPMRWSKATLRRSSPIPRASGPRYRRSKGLLRRSTVTLSRGRPALRPSDPPFGRSTGSMARRNVVLGVRTAPWAETAAVLRQGRRSAPAATVSHRRASQRCILRAAVCLRWPARSRRRPSCFNGARPPCCASPPRRCWQPGLCRSAAHGDPAPATCVR
jgi:hypothetical protein